VLEISYKWSLGIFVYYLNFNLEIRFRVLFSQLVLYISGGGGGEIYTL